MVYVGYNMVRINEQNSISFFRKCALPFAMSVMLMFSVHVIIKFNINRPMPSSLGASRLKTVTQCKQLLRNLRKLTKGAHESIHI